MMEWPFNTRWQFNVFKYHFLNFGGLDEKVVGVQGQSVFFKKKNRSEGKKKIYQEDMKKK